MKKIFLIIGVLVSTFANCQLLGPKGVLVDSNNAFSGKLALKADVSSIVPITTSGIADGDQLVWDLANARFKSFTPPIKPKTLDSSYTLGNFGIGYAYPSDVLYVKNKVGNNGITIQGGNGGAGVPRLAYYDSNFVLCGSIDILGINAGGSSAQRGIKVNIPAFTSGSDNWFQIRYTSANGKFAFGSTGYTNWIQTGSRLLIGPLRGSSPGVDTSTAGSLVITGNSLGITTSNLDPVASASLQINSTTKGVLIPRMTGAQMNAISSPACGLLVYNTDSLAFCYFNCTTWVNMAGGIVVNSFSTMTPPDTASIIAPSGKILSVTGTDFTTNIATATDVTGLTFWARGNKKYMIQGDLRVSCSGSGGVKFAISGPSGSALLWGDWIGTATVSGTPQYFSASAMGALSGTAFVRAALSGMTVSFRQYITTNGNAGPVTLQAASGTATQTSTVLIGSTIHIQEVN